MGSCLKSAVNIFSLFLPFLFNYSHLGENSFLCRQQWSRFLPFSLQSHSWSCAGCVLPQGSFLWKKRCLFPSHLIETAVRGCCIAHPMFLESIGCVECTVLPMGVLMRWVATQLSVVCSHGRLGFRALSPVSGEEKWILACRVQSLSALKWALGVTDELDGYTAGPVETLCSQETREISTESSGFHTPPKPWSDVPRRGEWKSG